MISLISLTAPGNGGLFIQVFGMETFRYENSLPSNKGLPGFDWELSKLLQLKPIHVGCDLPGLCNKYNSLTLFFSLFFLFLDGCICLVAHTCTVLLSMHPETSALGESGWLFQAERERERERAHGNTLMLSVLTVLVGLPELCACTCICVCLTSREARLWGQKCSPLEIFACEDDHANRNPPCAMTDKRWSIFIVFQWTAYARSVTAKKFKAWYLSPITLN